MTQKDGLALEVKNINKSFKLPTEQSNGIKQAFVNWTKGIKGYKKQQVLRDINFEVKKGDFFGIVGRNGSGKSTLLKIISQIYEPDSGKIAVNGSLVPFIELGVGFNPELTGRENIYMNGALLGFSTTEVNSMYDEIVDFAELHEFMDQKLKNYSSGMQVRLAFSIAIKAQGDILVLDEVLAVGDEAFQKKCNDYFYEMKKEKKTIILVTHSMEDVRRFCNKAMLISDGKIAKIGHPDEVADEYSGIFIEEQKEQLKKENQAIKLPSGEDMELSKAGVYCEGKKAQYIKHGQNFSIVAELKINRDIQNAVFAINLIDQEGRVMLATSTKNLKQKLNLPKGRTKITFDIQNIFPDGNYILNVASSKTVKNNEDLILKQAKIYEFEIGGAKYYKHSLTYPNIKINIE